jgi:hypothetical protein
MWPALIGAGRFAMQALPYLTAAMGAAPGLKEGNLGKAVLGGSLGYLGGGLGVGGLGSAQKFAGQRAGQAAAGLQTAVGQAGGLGAQKAAAGLLTAKNLRNAAAIGIPLAGAAAAVPIIGGLAGAAAAPVAGAAGAAGKAALGAAGLGRTATFSPEELTPYQYQTGAVPGINQYGYPGLLEQQNPLNAWQANLQYQRQEQDINNQNIARLANFQVGLADDVKKRDLQRSAAMAQLKTNLATLSALQLGGQQIAGQQATQALANIGAIAGTQYNY